MNEPAFPDTPSPEIKRDELLAGYWHARDISYEAGLDYVDQHLAPIILADAEAGMGLLESLAASDDVDARYVPATQIVHLPREVPKERYVVLARKLILDENDGVAGVTLESLFDFPIRDDLSWQDLREAVRAAVVIPVMSAADGRRYEAMPSNTRTPR